jgi:hypothetical protein
VVLTVTPANPELFADLSDVPARLRAERVRTLATLGLAATSGGSARIKLAAPASAGTEAHGERAPTRALSFARSLGDDV